MIMILSRDEILKAEDLERRTVPVPEWGGDVIVRAMTGAERDAYEASCFKDRGPGEQPVRDLSNVRAKLVSRTVIGEDGVRLFTDNDIGALGEKSAAALARVFDVAAELSKLGEGDIADLAGNSDAAPSGDSTSGSPATSDAPSPVS